MLKTILIGAVVVIALILVVAATRPATFRVERSATIKAPPEKIFALINDFHVWGAWSPWEKIDADLKRTFSGEKSGKGAVYEWEGKKSGSGRMEIVESTLPTDIKIKIDFLKPMEAHNTIEFSLKSQGDMSTISWSMSGNNNLVGKLFSLFMSMDKMVGKDFETGLSTMKAVAEK